MECPESSAIAARYCWQESQAPSFVASELSAGSTPVIRQLFRQADMAYPREPMRLMTALRIGGSNLVHAPMTRCKSVSTDANSRPPKPCECSACAARYPRQKSQGQEPSAVAPKSPAGSNPVPSASFKKAPFDDRSKGLYPSDYRFCDWRIAFNGHRGRDHYSGRVGAMPCTLRLSEVQIPSSVSTFD